MTSQEKDRFICKQFGIIHKGREFISEAGRVQLLKLARQHKDYDDFGERYLIFASWDDADKKVFAIPERYMTDNNGLFQSIFFHWLGGEG